MPQLDNFSAWISIDDHPLQEYGVQYSEDLLTVVCWIASEAGKPFTISWRDCVRSQASMGRTFVDGIRCGVPKGINRRGYKKDLNKENDTANQRSVPTSSGQERRLVFSNVDYIAEETFAEQKVGEIRLEISNVEKRGPTTLQVNSFQVEGKVHEMTKQMTPHCTRLGGAIKGDKKPVHLVKTTGKKRIFVFNYRPFEVLKAIGIPGVPEHLEKSITSLSNGSEPRPDAKIDMTEHSPGIESTNGEENVTNRKEIKIKSEDQTIKKEEDVKIEEKQFKFEVKTEDSLSSDFVRNTEGYPKLE